MPKTLNIFIWGLSMFLTLIIYFCYYNCYCNINFNVGSHKKQNKCTCHYIIIAVYPVSGLMVD